MEYQINSSFPIEILPESLILLVDEADKYLNCSVDYFISSIFSATSIAIGNNYQLKLKDNFNVKCNLFIALVGDAGDGKSHPLKLAFKPVYEMESLSYDKYKNDLKEYELLDDENKKQSDKPVYLKSILKDFTPESLLKIHSLNLKGVNIVVDELFGWINSFGRYSKSSGEQEMYLSLWSGDSITVDRKGDEPVRIDNTFVGLIGTLQTKLLSNLKNDNRDNNGFIERMLFALNRNPKPLLWNENDINNSLIEMYNNFIYSLYTKEFVDKGSIDLMMLAKEAKEYLIDWQNEKRKSYFYANLPNHTAILAKYEVYVLRFSIILQTIYSYYCNMDRLKIGLFTIQSAIKLVEYYFENAIRVHNLIHNKDPLKELTEKQKTLYKKLEYTFQTKDIVKIGNELDLPERTTKAFLKNKIDILFTKLDHGKYNKLY